MHLVTFHCINPHNIKWGSYRCSNILHFNPFRILVWLKYLIYSPLQTHTWTKVWHFGLVMFQICGKKLSCGQHVCEKVCHSGECGMCPRAGRRTCPCEKTVFDLPCTEDVPTCPDTCGKLLSCDLHTCTQRCHIGPCGTVRIINSSFS